MNRPGPSHDAGWLALRRGHRTRPLEWLVEKSIFLVAASTILIVFLIFAFVLREALPVFTGQTNSALVQPILPASDFARIPRPELQTYLGLTDAQMRRMDDDTLRTLMEVREEAGREIPAAFREDKDATINTSQWRYLLRPHQWTAYNRPEYIWQPVGQIHKYNIVPLFVGSLKTTLVGLFFAVPVAVAAALYVSQLASPRAREWIKPAIEMLSGIPSVVIGMFGLLVLASLLQSVFGYPTRLNAFVAGIALALAVIPLVFTISEDALTSVPQSYTHAALALGASRWQAAWQIVLPAALPGVLAATLLGFGRAIGETMIVLMICSAPVMSWSFLDSARTITTTIAAEMAEAVAGGHHYAILFTLGTLLFAVTFLSNLAGQLIVQRFKARLEGRR